MNYESTLQRALQNVNGDRVALAMPYDLPQRVCHDLIERELVQALVADSVECAQLDASCAGWWVDRERDQIHLRQGVGPTILIAGVEDSRRVGPRLLLEARLKGVRRVVTTNRDGNLLEDLQVDAALIERLDSGVAASRLTGPTFEEAFEELYELVGDQLRMPPGSFVTNKVAMYVGSLGPGGAERQCTYTAAGIGKLSDWHPLIVCDHLDPPLDFFRPYVESKGVQVVPVDNTPAELTQPKIVEIRDLFAKKYSALNFAQYLCRDHPLRKHLENASAIAHSLLDGLLQHAGRDCGGTCRSARDRAQLPFAGARPLSHFSALHAARLPRAAEATAGNDPEQ